MTVLVPGAFDLFHYGHARLLARASRFGEVVVALASDEFVALTKGHSPAEMWDDRARALRRRGYEVVMRGEADIRPILDVLRPDYWVTGHDWLGDRHLAHMRVTAEEVAERGIAMVYLPRTPGVSSTMLRERVGV